MSRRVAQRQAAGGDGISHLPVEILDHIMGLLPIEEAAKTAVLSKVWRDVWSNLSQLCFDKRFFSRFDRKHRHAKCICIHKSLCLDAVGEVLLQHKGRIRKFVLLFSCDCADIVWSRSDDMDRWLLFLTQRGVVEIHFRFGSRQYMLPDCVLSCSTLKRLHLSNLYIHPRNSPCALPNLTSLGFHQVFFYNRDITNFVIDVPRLEDLSFDSMDVSPFNIIARCICTFKISHCSLSEVGKFLPAELDLRSIRTLDLDYYTLQFFVDGYTPNGRPLRLPALNVESLKLSSFCFKNVPSTPAFVRLLSKCPNLYKLDLSFLEGEGSTFEHLKQFRSVIQKHRRLLFLKLRDFKGSSSQMQFIKEMLACLPSLEEVVIVCNPYPFSCRTDYEIMEEVLSCPRASTKAKIVCYGDDHPRVHLIKSK